MGRGDRHRVRWARDRQRRVKAREKRQSEERAAGRKSTKSSR
ncbi:MAG: hypothetical protein ACRDH8_05110 [Actinomycetota bacterium]